MSRAMQEQVKQIQPKQQSQPKSQSQFTQQSESRQLAQSPPKPKQPQSIHELAYRLWENAGRPEGQSERFWLEAEEQIQRSAIT